MNQKFTTPFVCLLFYFSCFLVSGSTTSIDKDIEGRWYGSYYLTSGKTFQMIMDIERLKKNQFRIEIYYPEYFNSKYGAKGIIDGSDLIIGSTGPKQGVGTFSSEYSDEMVLSIETDNKLNGTYYVNNEILAEVELMKEDVISQSKISGYANLIEKSNQAFGLVKIFEELRIDKDSLKDVVVNAVSAFNSMNPETMVIQGNMNAGGVEFPALMEFHMPNSMYIELDFQGHKFLNVTTDKVKWEYNPVTDKLTVDSLSESESRSDDGLNNFIGSLSKSIQDGYEIDKVYRSTIDDRITYRLLLTKESDIRIFYIDPSSSYLIRQEISYKVHSYENYRDFQGIPIPTRVKEYSTDGQSFEFNFSKFEFNVPLDKGKLEMPEWLRSKMDLLSDDDTDAYLEKAKKFQEEGSYEEARKYYKLSIESNGEAGWIYFRMGKCAHQLGNYYEAIGDFQKAIDLDPSEAKYFNDMGLAKYALEDYNNAIKDFDKALSIDSTMSVTYSNKANAYYVLDDKDNSYVNFGKAILNDSLSSGYYASHGIVGVEVGDFENARKSLKQALFLEYSDSAKINNWIGISYYRTNVFDSAAFYFKKSTIIEAGDFDYQKNLGTAYFEFGDIESAKVSFEEALKLNSKDDDLYNYLGLSYYKTTDYDGANFYFNKAIEINSKNATYYDNRAYTFEAMGSYSKAIEDFTISIQLYPDDPEIFYQRGLIHRLQHDNFTACQDLKKAADMGHEKAKEEYKKCGISSDD